MSFHPIIFPLHIDVFWFKLFSFQPNRPLYFLTTLLNLDFYDVTKFNHIISLFKYNNVANSAISRVKKIFTMKATILRLKMTVFLIFMMWLHFTIFKYNSLQFKFHEKNLYNLEHYLTIEVVLFFLLMMWSTLSCHQTLKMDITGQDHLHHEKLTN